MRDASHEQATGDRRTSARAWRLYHRFAAGEDHGARRTLQRAAQAGLRAPRLGAMGRLGPLRLVPFPQQGLSGRGGRRGLAGQSVQPGDSRSRTGGGDRAARATPHRTGTRGPRCGADRSRDRTGQLRLLAGAAGIGQTGRDQRLQGDLRRRPRQDRECPGQGSLSGVVRSRQRSAGPGCHERSHRRGAGGAGRAPRPGRRGRLRRFVRSAGSQRGAVAAPGGRGRRGARCRFQERCSGERA